MTGADRPLRRDNAADPVCDEGGRVIPFPRGGRHGVQRDDDRWTFTTEVHLVDGPESKWLRRELAGVLRDLLAWADDDMADDALQNDRQERAA